MISRATPATAAIPVTHLATVIGWALRHRFTSATNIGIVVTVVATWGTVAKSSAQWNAR